MGITAIINIEIDTAKLLDKFQEFQVALPGICKFSINQSMDLLQGKVKQIIDSDLKWGHSLNSDERIENCWIREFPSDDLGVLINKSPHAFVSNYGSLGVQQTITRPGGGAMPVGKQEYGHPVAYSPKVIMQPGKYWAEQSVFSSLDEIKAIFEKNLNDALRKL